MTLQQCQYQPECPGCPHFGEGQVSPGVAERLRSLATQVGAPEPSFFSTPGFRRRFRARLSVRGTSQNPEIGIFAARSHRLVDIEHCPLHHESIEQLIAVVKAGIREVGLSPYDERAHRGELRAVQFAVEEGSGRVQLVLVLCQQAGDEVAGAAHLAELLAQHERIHSVFFNYQPEKTNTLLGDQFHPVSGPSALEGRSGQARVFYPPGAFGQANPVEHSRAVELIFKMVAPGAQVAEFYAGVGSIGLGLAERGHRVSFNELGSGSLEGLRRGLDELGVAAEVSVGRAGDALHLLSGAETVIVDPPRKGLDQELLCALLGNPPAQLIYLSCGLASLEREMPALVEAGLSVRNILAFPYFPFTDHVETLVDFAVTR